MKRVFFPLLLAATIGVAAVSPALASDEVNVYSARKEYLIKPLLDRFTEQTGVEVNLVTARAGALLQRLKSEGRNTPADLLVTVDAGNLHRAKAAGLLQPVESSALQNAIPAQLRDLQGHWFGLSKRARVIVYVKDRVSPQELSSYEDLADPKWKKRICIRSSSNVYNQSLVASMIMANGEQATEDWAKGLVANMGRPPKGGDRDQLKAAAVGQCDIAVMNTYYLGRMLGSSKAEELEPAQAAAVFWPNQQGRGTHVNVSGAGVVNGSKNRDNAVRLLEFMVNDDSQQWYAEVNNEYPVKPGVPVSDILASWGSFREDSVNLAKLGESNAAAVRLMDRAGWK
jgi:iron(III) transport system substrate-binding protein